MILKCCIIDDEPLAIELLESYVKKTPFLQLEASFTSAVQAIERISKGDIDLIFLDIQMPELDGMEFSRMIEGKSRVIFTTAFAQYAVDSYKVNAVDYLLKPFAYTDFLKAAQKALQWFELSSGTGEMHSPDKSYIFVKSDYKLKQIPLDKVLYIEGLKDYVIIQLDEQRVITRMNLKNIFELLPKHDFLRVNKSYIVNTKYIDSFDNNDIFIKTHEIAIGNTYRDAFFEAFMRMG